MKKRKETNRCREDADTHVQWTQIIKTADKIKVSTRKRKKEKKQAENYLSVQEEIASINSMNSEVTKTENQTESEIVTNTSTLERKYRAARKDRE